MGMHLYRSDAMCGGSGLCHVHMIASGCWSCWLHQSQTAAAAAASPRAGSWQGGARGLGNKQVSRSTRPSVQTDRVAQFARLYSCVVCKNVVVVVVEGCQEDDAKVRAQSQQVFPLSRIHTCDTIAIQCGVCYYRTVCVRAETNNYCWLIIRYWT